MGYCPLPQAAISALCLTPVRFGTPFFLSWLPEHIRSSLTRCAQVAHPLRNFGPKTVRKLIQPKTLCRLPLCLDQQGVATPLTCVRGFRLAAKARLTPDLPYLLKWGIIIDALA